MQLPQTYFRERHARGCNGLTLINYPGIPAGKGADEAASTARASAHKDWVSPPPPAGDRDEAASLTQ